MNASIQRLAFAALIAAAAAFVWFIATKLGVSPAVALGLFGFVLIAVKVSE